MEFTAQKIAEMLHGEIEGDPTILVHNISKIEEGKVGTLAFLANPKYENYIYNTKASVVLVNKTFSTEKKIETTLIKVDNAYSAFASLLEIYQQLKGNKQGISPQAFIHESATIGQNVYIEAFAYVGENAIVGNNTKIYGHSYLGDNTQVGSDCTLYAGVKIYEDCVIGNSCIFHAGVVIGSDGFGFAPVDNDYKKIPQIGNVIVEDHVEMGANTTIDRATMGSTVIRKGVKLDNQIQVAHNVEIGENTVIAALTGISGSTKIGKNCMIGGQVGFAGHIQIADEVKIGAQAGVASSIKQKGMILLGTPAIEVRNFQRSSIVFKQLPELLKRVGVIEKKSIKTE